MTTFVWDTNVYLRKISIARISGENINPALQKTNKCRQSFHSRQIIESSGKLIPCLNITIHLQYSCIELEKAACDACGYFAENQALLRTFWA